MPIPAAPTVARSPPCSAGSWSTKLTSTGPGTCWPKLRTTAIPEHLTDDRLLGGRVRLQQPASGFRAAIDPVLLAAAVPAGEGDIVLDVGCGTGAAALCLATRVEAAHVTGIEAD